MDFDFSRYPYLHEFSDMPTVDMEYRAVYPKDGAQDKVYRLTGEDKEILFDFNEEVVGFFRFSAKGKGEIRVDYGEKLNELYDRDESFLPDWYETPYEELQLNEEVFSFFSSKGRRACRYVRVRANEAELKDVVFICVNAKNDLDGYFRCSNEKLNDVYDICKRTTKLCMQDYFEDGIKRDGLLWIGDARVEMQCDYAVFGNEKIVQRSILYSIRAMREDGWISTNATIGGANQHPQMIEYMFDFIGGKKPEGTPEYFEGCGEIYYLTYSADFIGAIWEYYLYSGNKAFVEKVFPYVRKVVRRLCDIDHFDVEGKLMPRTQYPYRQYVDNLCDAGSYFFSLVYSLKLFKKICALVGEEEPTLEKDIEDFTNAAKAYMDEDGVVWRQWKETEKVYAPTGQAFAYLAELCNREQFRFAMQKMNGNPLTAYPEAGLAKYWFFKGLCASGMITEALQGMQKEWGALVDMGNTTCEERWDSEHIQETYKDISLSSCHGWSAGAMPLLVEYVLGVKRLEDGKISIEPNLGGLEFAEGTVPTPKGLLFVRVSKDGVEYRAPAGLEIIVK